MKMLQETVNMLESRTERDEKKATKKSLREASLEKQGAAHARALRSLPDMGEYVVRGAWASGPTGQETWIAFRELGQYKVSPYGSEGDYDRDAYYVDEEDLGEHFRLAGGAGVGFAW